MGVTDAVSVDFLSHEGLRPLLRLCFSDFVIEIKPLGLTYSTRNVTSKTTLERRQNTLQKSI